MEKVNEVGKFKQRMINYMYSSNDNCFNLDVNLVHSYRFNYIINKDNLSMFLDYIGYLSIPELGIENCKVKVSSKNSNYYNVYLTLKGHKEYAKGVDVVLRDLCYGFGVIRGELNEQSVH